MQNKRGMGLSRSNTTNFTTTWHFVSVQPVLLKTNTPHHSAQVSRTLSSGERGVLYYSPVGTSKVLKVGSGRHDRGWKSGEDGGGEEENPGILPFQSSW